MMEFDNDDDAHMESNGSSVVGKSKITVKNSKALRNSKKVGKDIKCT